MVAAPPPYIPTLHEGDLLPTIPLVAQDGRAFSLADLRPNRVIVSFIYTRCRDSRMCPLVSSKFARIQTLIGKSPVRLVEITLDPAYDTPAVLRRYGAMFDERPNRWTLATGAPGSIDQLAGRFGIVASIPTPGVVVHSEAAVVLDPEGRISRIIDGNDWQPDSVFAAALPSAPEGILASMSLWLQSAVARCGGGDPVIGTMALLAIAAAVFAGVSAVFARALRGALFGQPQRSIRPRQ